MKRRILSVSIAMALSSGAAQSSESNEVNESVINDICIKYPLVCSVFTNGNGGGKQPPGPKKKVKIKGDDNERL